MQAVMRNHKRQILPCSPARLPLCPLPPAPCLSSRLPVSPLLRVWPCAPNHPLKGGQSWWWTLARSLALIGTISRTTDILHTSSGASLVNRPDQLPRSDSSQETTKTDIQSANWTLCSAMDDIIDDILSCPDPPWWTLVQSSNLVGEFAQANLMACLFKSVYLALIAFKTCVCV